MGLNELGAIVLKEWKRSEEMREEVLLDAFVVMPNHLHGIVCLVPAEVDAISPRGYDLRIGSESTSPEKTSNDDVGPHGDAALHERDQHPRWKEGRPQRHARSLGSMIAGFKGTTTKQINQHRGTPGAPVWQARYHDRVLRNEQEWRACRRYIEQNPGRWGEDRYAPTR
jgi:REP element-mobilizing transposase RayT